VVPTSIEADGASVYATYKAGDKDIFIELAFLAAQRTHNQPWTYRASIQVDLICLRALKFRRVRCKRWKAGGH